MTLRLYNTMARAVEPFTALNPPRVSMYTCGPTVWNYAHIGNFRTFFFEDLLRRWLEASGYDVFHVMNLTDVDDRTIATAAERGVSLAEHVQPYTEAFFADRDYLRIRPAHEYPRATGYIPQMVALVQGLLDRGVAYAGEDGSVYFSIARFPAYGRLSRLDPSRLQSGASGRISSDEYAKEDARDFVLWKAAVERDEQVGAAWPAPFGRGRPGWHLECSAMALDLLKARWGTDVLDIHAGGVDLIFPHHEDEIAQSCAFTGRQDFARYWLHGEFLNVSGTKMSKRFGNITTARDLRDDGVDAGTVRLLMCQTHYRQKLDLNDQALEAAREGSRRLGEFDRRLREVVEADRTDQADRADRTDAAFRERVAETERVFTAAMDDDLNAPRALAALFDFVREGNRLLDQRAVPGGATLEAWTRWATGVLDVLPGAGPADPELEAWVAGRLEARREARLRRDFTAADAIRDELAARGVVVEDTPAGPKWKVR